MTVATDTSAITMPEGTHLAYTIYHETKWWSELDKNTRPNEGRRCIQVAASAKGQGGGVRWEFGIVEYNLDRPALCLEIFDEGWEAFGLMAPFFAELAASGYRAGWTLAEVRELLDSLGAVDETDRG